MEPILEVSGLTKAFEDRERKTFYAVDHISFQIMPGQTIGIVGESGSGKSTLAKLLCCLEEPTEGQIRLCGPEIGKQKRKKRREMYRNIQMVFQDPVSSFDPRRTLGDGIGESLRNNGISRQEAWKQAEQLLDTAGIRYTVRFAEENRDAVRTLGIRQAPTLVFGGQKWTGVSGVREFIAAKENANV